MLDANGLTNERSQVCRTKIKSLIRTNQTNSSDNRNEITNWNKRISCETPNKVNQIGSYQNSYLKLRAVSLTEIKGTLLELALMRSENWKKKTIETPRESSAHTRWPSLTVEQKRIYSNASIVRGALIRMLDTPPFLRNWKEGNRPNLNWRYDTDRTWTEIRDLTEMSTKSNSIKW